MKRKVVYHYDESTQVSTCTIFERDNQFVGKAKCAPEDAQYGNASTGLYIAEIRATIAHHKKLLKTVRLKMNTLENFYSQIKNSKGFNPKGSTEKALLKQLRAYQLEILFLKEAIDYAPEMITLYCERKDRLYRTLETNKAIKESHKEMSAEFTEIAKDIEHGNPMGLSNLYYLGELFPGWEEKEQKQEEGE